MREFPLFWVAALVGGIRVTGELRVIVGRVVLDAVGVLLEPPRVLVSMIVVAPWDEVGTVRGHLLASRRSDALRIWLALRVFRLDFRVGLVLFYLLFEFI